MASSVFAAMRVPNFRMYLTGQSVSLVGTWMQSVALSWLVLQLTGSGTMLGLVVATQCLPLHSGCLRFRRGDPGRRAGRFPAGRTSCARCSGGNWHRIHGDRQHHAAAHF